MRFKKSFIVITLVLIMLLSVTVMAQNTQKEQKEKIAATVNGEKITMQQLKNFTGIEPLLMKMLRINQEFTGFLIQSEAGNQLIEDYRKMKLNQLIMSELVVQETQKRGMTLNDEKKDEIFQKQLDALMSENDKTLEELTTDIKKDYDSVEDYKNEFFSRNKMGILVRQLREDVISDVTVTDDEAQEYYNNNKENFRVSKQKKVKHILVDEKEKAEDILAQLKNGADFEEMAKKHSTDSSAEKGGNLGYLVANQRGMDPAFMEAVMQLDKGEMSGVVESQSGFHIIKVTDVKESYIEEFNKVKDDLKKELLNQKKNKKWGEFLDKLREEADVEIMI
ncbi:MULTISPECIES: peptidylprolyl isomerase [unclassified Halanaerobium]|uniref:peptidylprolyl isomerase n=1 Tax=unclassified Halanaerobium TaxID=2641197 RepID=UPI000DF44A83|nr:MULTISPECIES: peptidylprolyl isomerase [unclassified Halanaerobium]RCW41688.1 peptidyl-prolyl cis-trans isomerase C/foldase protein PrsA [Halanaerobium sp. MA284_MarDTE_T2]RCW79473.1 peptidyl-prolyl cis-trans isomerase C/foldase protein PrsA [Halanaerobium sp. DL-01]